MSKNNLQNSSLVLHTTATIEEAMGAITDNQRGTVVIVDDDFIFQGVVSDGDMRRAMLQGATRLTPVSKIVNMNATVIEEKEAAAGKAEEVFNQKSDIRALPVVDAHNKLVDVIIRDPEKRKEL